jgi:hypothetical protein
MSKKRKIDVYIIGVEINTLTTWRINMLNMRRKKKVGYMSKEKLMYLGTNFWQTPI